MSTMTVPGFVAKWQSSTRSERSASLEQFIEVCRLVGHPTPSEAGPKGEFFAFNKGDATTTGRQRSDPEDSGFGENQARTLREPEQTR